MSSKRCTSNIDYLSPKQRQDIIYETIFRCGSTTVKNLASRFNVSERTIRRDITVLMRSTPIELTRGRNAAVQVSDGCKLKAPVYSPLNSIEKQYLKNLVDIVPQNDVLILKNIIAKVAS